MSPNSLPIAALGIGPIPRSTWMTWGVMVFLVAVALIVRAQVSEREIGRLQGLFEMFMEQLCDLIREIVRADPEPYVPLVGTLFIFVLTANLLGMVPGLESPTADISVTAGLAAVVFFAVPFYGVRARGVGNYLKSYVQPNPFMLPFNVLSELTRTLALAVRLFGNIMSSNFLLLVIIGVVTTTLRGYAHVFMLPTYALTLFLSVLSLIVAFIQAYIFTVLALVYIGAGVERRLPKPEEETPAGEEEQ